MERFQRTALHPAVSLKPELPRVHAIDQTMNTEQNLGLRTVRVDTLGNGNQANAGKRQALVEVQRVGQFAGSREVSSIGLASKARALMDKAREGSAF